MSPASSEASSPETAAAGVVVVAGGAGTRAGGGVAKQYRAVAGVPVLLRAVRAFLDHPRVGAIVVVLPAADAADPQDWLRTLPVTIVAGGAERGDSVWNGLQALPAAADPVLIHDGARPFVTAAVIGRVIDAARTVGAVAALPVRDTLKEVDADGQIRATPHRSRFWQAQTPQGFPRAMIIGAYRRARAEAVAATDDAALCEQFGATVRVVEGAPENFKITHPADLEIAEALARRLR